jgi:hypothetical protein
MKLSRKAVTTAGIINANVTSRKVRHCDAPHIRLASSSAGSIERNASTMNRNRNGVEYCSMCQITPP